MNINSTLFGSSCEKRGRSFLEFPGAHESVRLLRLEFTKKTPELTRQWMESMQKGQAVLLRILSSGSRLNTDKVDELQVLNCFCWSPFHGPRCLASCIGSMAIQRTCS